MSLQNAIELLCSHNKLEKDKGAHQFEKLLATNAFDYDTHIKGLEEQLLNILRDDKSSWEEKHGSLTAFHCLIRSSNTNQELQNELLYQILEPALKFLTYGEPLVCQAAVALIENLFQRFKTEVHKNLRQTIMQHIQTDLEQLLNYDQCDLKQTENINIKAVPDDCRGWEKIEPSIKVLKCTIEGSDRLFLADKQLISLIMKICSHTNHFVREAGFNLLTSLVQTLNCDDVNADNPLVCFGEELSNNVSFGLNDDSAQVRLAASVAARHFLLSLAERDRLIFFPQLLPSLCLNRYYSTDIVRIYSQETWRQVAGVSGKELVEQFIEPTVDYYERCAQSENSAVREASCSCITELVTNIPVGALQPFVAKLLNTLLTCYQDTSWTVLDAACIACGSFIITFPEECSPLLEKLYSMFYFALGNVMPSVQQGAAHSLSNVARTYGEKNLGRIISYLEEGLKSMQHQKGCNSMKELRKQSIESFHKVVVCDIGKTEQPWRTANGCVYLLGELSNVKQANEKVVSCLPLLKNAASLKNYPEHVIFLETLCQKLPVIAKNLGKIVFLNHITLFIDDIFYALECENRLTSSAASKCLNQLATLLGQNILRSKITECNVLVEEVSKAKRVGKKCRLESTSILKENIDCKNIVNYET